MNSDANVGGFAEGGVEMDFQILSDASPLNFADRLNSAIVLKKAPVCIGLDPRLDMIPQFILGPVVKKFGQSPESASKAILEFNKGIIDAVADLVPAVKPQIAFFEKLGFYGYLAFEQTCKYAKSKGLIVIADVKRSDIDSTAQAYADYFLGKVDLFGKQVQFLDADAVTVNPYMGYDSLKPFLDVADKEGKGVFVLVKTSNKSSGDLQDRGVDDGEKLYEIVGRFVDSWGADMIGGSGYSSVGAVVGATYPAEAKKLRELMPNAIFLVPGYGSQGAGAKDIVHCFNKDGLGAIVNASRSVNYAYVENGSSPDGSHFKDAARNATMAMINEINSAL